MTAEPAPLRSDPLPDELADRLDMDRVPFVVGDWLSTVPELAGLLAGGVLSWVLDGWSDTGRATVSVFVRESAVEVARCELHWSSLAPAGV